MSGELQLFEKVLWSGVSVAAGVLIAAFCLAKTKNIN